MELKTWSSENDCVNFENDKIFRKGMLKLVPAFSDAMCHELRTVTRFLLSKPWKNSLALSMSRFTAYFTMATSPQWGEHQARQNTKSSSVREAAELSMCTSYASYSLALKKEIDGYC
jgi:hypothetical protein